VIGARLAAYSCGGSRGIGEQAAPRSLLIPEGNHPAQDAIILTEASTLQFEKKLEFEKAGLRATSITHCGPMLDDREAAPGD
jgi:hypothetical protein